AHPLDQVRPAGAAGVHRALRVGADDPYPAAGDLLEVPPGAAHRAPGPDTGHEMGDPTVGLRPQFRAGGPVVRDRVVGVGVLVRLPGVLPLPDQPVGHLVVRTRVLRSHRGRADHHFGAVRPQHVDLVDGDLVRADEHAPVTALLGHQGQTDAGVAAGRLDDGA